MKKYVSWNEVNKFVQQVVHRYAEHDIPGVYGLPRGGLVLAVMISHRLNIPMLMSPVEGCLLVDDICDSGESLVHYTKNTSAEIDKPSYHIVTMYFKENRLGVLPEMYSYQKGNDWIVFPWEEDEPIRGLMG